jgi:hypothetical protein
VAAPDFIVPPPGLIPAAAPRAVPDQTVRGAPPRPLPAFAPVPGIVPPAASGPPESTTTANAPAAAPAPAHGVWRLRGAGVEVLLDRAFVLGRDPAPDPVRSAAALALVDPARSVSKTHALVDVVDDQVVITDLHSTNGTRVLDSDGHVRELDAGHAAAAPSGSTVMLGEFALRVDRAPLDTV